MPDWVRIQPSTWLSSSVTKNIRSASPKCAIEKMAMRGLPAAEWSSRLTSSGSPCNHDAKPGDARRLFKSIARLKRSFAGKNASMSITPMRRKGGFCTSWINAARSRPRPWAQACWRICDSRIVSRLFTGSAPRPIRPSNPATVEPTRSRSSSASSMTSSGGGANELNIDSGRPALLPGV